MQVVRQCPRCGVPQLGAVCTTCGYDPVALIALENDKLRGERVAVHGVAWFGTGWLVAIVTLCVPSLSPLSMVAAIVGTLVGVGMFLDGSTRAHQARRRLADAIQPSALPAARIHDDRTSPRARGGS